MTLSRIALLTSTCALAGFGIYGLVAPKRMLKVVDVRPSSRKGTTELRAMYGGFELGLAAFFAVAMLRPELERAALWAHTLSLSGLAATRLGSILYDRPNGALLKALVAVEGGTAVLGAAALRSRAA
ncbi:MAG TPA: DUF4345 family protein [Terriglobales bacterium]